MPLPLYSFTNKYRSGRREDFSSHTLRYWWVNYYKGNCISGHEHYTCISMLGTPALLSFDRHFSYNVTKGKTYLVNQRWRHTTCLQHPFYDVGCYPCNMYCYLFRNEAYNLLRLPILLIKRYLRVQVEEVIYERPLQPQTDYFWGIFDPIYHELAIYGTRTCSCK